MKIKGIIFDLDGTLIDSMWYWDKLGEEFLAERGKTPLPDFREKYYVYSTLATAQMIIDDYGLKDETADSVIESMLKMAEKFYITRVETKPHVLEMLERFRAAGIKMAVATATERGLVDTAINRCGIGGYFETIVTCTDVNASKTKPDVYLKALESLDCNVEETAVFEDAIQAAKTAKTAGFYTVGVYDGTAAEYESQMRSICDEYITDFAQLSDVFK